MEKDKNLTHICIIKTPGLPVPDFEGGAIEALLTLLINENEKKQNLRIHLIEQWNENVERIQERYKYTKFHFIDSKDIEYGWTIGRMRHYIKRIAPKLCSEQKYTIEAKKYLKCILKEEHIDAVIIEGGLYDDFGIITKIVGRKRMYLHLHHEVRNNIYLNRIYGNTISVSSFIMSRWKDSFLWGDTNDVVLKNAIDISRFTNRITGDERERIRKSIGCVDSTDYLVMYCGRIIEEKGVIELEHAIEFIKDASIKLVIVGQMTCCGIPERDEYVEEVKRICHRNQDRIILHGYVDNDQLYKLYQAVDLLVVPSLWEEAAGLVLIEAQVSGIPVIATRSGGIPEYIYDKTKVLIERDDRLVENLAQRIVLSKNQKDSINSQMEEQIAFAEKFNQEQLYRDFLNLMG